MTEKELRKKVADKIMSYKGIVEGSSEHKKLVDYWNANRTKCLTRNVYMTMAYDWCAMTVSVIYMMCGLIDIFDIEVSCGNLINLAKKRGTWVEDDNYMPNVGDVIIYGWAKYTPYSDETVEHDHTGIVVSVNTSAQTFVVCEGNKGDKVDTRQIPRNYGYIRGFITPKFSLVADKESSTSGVVEDKVALGTTETEVKPTVTTSLSKISEDGNWGKVTTKRAQKIFKTSQDGIVSEQDASDKKYITAYNLNSWEFKTNPKGGSELIKAIQTFLKNKGYSVGTIDGLFGKNTSTCLQKFLKSKGFYTGTIDAIFGKKSVIALQKYLNSRI